MTPAFSQWRAALLWALLLWTSIELAHFAVGWSEACNCSQIVSNKSRLHTCADTNTLITNLIKFIYLHTYTISGWSKSPLTIFHQPPTSHKNTFPATLGGFVSPHEKKTPKLEFWIRHGWKTENSGSQAALTNLDRAKRWQNHCCNLHGMKNRKEVDEPNISNHITLW